MEENTMSVPVIVAAVLLFIFVPYFIERRLK